MFSENYSKHVLLTEITVSALHEGNDEEDYEEEGANGEGVLHHQVHDHPTGHLSLQQKVLDYQSSKSTTKCTRSPVISVYNKVYKITGHLSLKHCVLDHQVYHRSHLSP